MDPTLNTDSTNKESDIPNTENKGPNPDNKVPLATFVASVAQQQFNKEREKLEAELTHKIEEQFKAKYAHLTKPGSENLADSRKRDRGDSSEEDEPPSHKKSSLRKDGETSNSIKKSRTETTKTTKNSNNKGGSKKHDNQDGDEELYNENEEDEYDMDDTVSLPDDSINEELLKLLGGSGDPSDHTPDEEDETDFFVLHKDITDKLLDALKKDEVSESIKPELAELLKKIWTQKVGNSKTVKNIIETAVRPENCEFFCTPKINNQIRSYMKVEAKSQDSRLERSQKFLTTAAISVAQMVQKLMSLDLKCNDNDKSSMKTTLTSARQTISALKTNVTDAFTMLAYMNSGMVQFRKDKICRTIDKKLRGIRNIHEPDSRELFGDDVMNNLKLAHKNFTLMQNNKQQWSKNGNKWDQNSKNWNWKQDSWNQKTRKPRGGKRGGNRPQRGRGGTGKRGGRRGGFQYNNRNYDNYYDYEEDHY